MKPNNIDRAGEHMPEARQTAVLIQRKLLENFVAMARSAVNEEMLKASLKNTLDVSVEIAGAQTGSLFLLDEQGIVIDSILTSGEKDPDRQSVLLGTVLDKGLAGWVRLHRTLCLIEDTLTDDRWLTLPNPAIFSPIGPGCSDFAR
jgi:sigma-B regulation protein RsbU (phosphoserine phosphatase)